ncbi:MAG: flavodoxin family protein [Dehalococcoidia bacterium]|nr:putative NAD(P)H-dependent FMN-containing oxidoreductase YwqN [Chloroflexota bacterium]MBT9161527.1 putative NAD(P)H-dependent FMN-containing oxidoreductase YwqN [Chloroflexota bacterium]
MKVLGIAGSPRRGGNTDLLLEQAVAGARGAGAETEVVVLHGLNIFPCRHCGGCLEDGRCVIEDDMQWIYTRLRESDRLIIASPVFFMGLTAQTKMMIDRCQALWAMKYVLKRPVAISPGRERKGLFISVGGTGFSKLFQPSLATIKSFFIVLDMVLAGEVTFAMIDEKEAIKEHPTALQDAFDAGKRLASSIEY